MLTSFLLSRTRFGTNIWLKQVWLLLICVTTETCELLTLYLTEHEKIGERRKNVLFTLTPSQCTLAGLVYTGMTLECHWLTQCTLGYHWANQRILGGYTGTPLEKLSWNSPSLECHWRNLVETSPHWEATGETLTFAAYTGTPLEGLWQPTHAPTHIVKHAD